MSPDILQKRTLANARACAEYFANIVLRNMSKSQVEKLLSEVDLTRINTKSITIEELDKSIQIMTKYLGIKQFDKYEK